MPWNTVFEHEVWSISDDEYNLLAAQKIRPFQETEQLGIPHGRHGEATFWEFSLAASFNYCQIVEQVEWLCLRGLLRPSLNSYPLHLTLGGLTAVGHHAEGVRTLLRLLESTRWACSPERLILPFTRASGAWAIKGTAGIRQRLPSHGNLELDMTTAVELRTLELSGVSGLKELLANAQALGVALLAYQYDRGSKLGECWWQAQQSIEELFDRFDLANPSCAWSPPTGMDHSHSSPFFRLSELLEEELFVDQARKLVQIASRNITTTIRRKHVLL